MSSADSEPHLENTSSLNGHENNEFDEDSTTESEIEQENKIEKKLKNKYLNKMLYLLKELFIMVVVAITYAAITNDAPKVGKSPAAYKFFKDNSHVTDWYRGEISDAINQARSADVAFVMFYAPWDAECQHARKEFQILARHMHQQVTFSAVNCWQPGSECRTQYGKVHKWPILIAYPTHGRGIQYNGPLVAVHMMTFLKKLISPFSTKFPTFHLSQHDAVIHGRVNPAPFSKEFNVFYQIALRLLERDPLQDIAVTIETKGQDGMQPTISIYTWNETLNYLEDEWEIEPILNWILKHVHQVTSWISPTGTKSASLSQHLQPGPALILFTPRNPLAGYNDYYSMLKMIALEYSSCGENHSTKMSYILMQVWRLDKYIEQRRQSEECKSKKSKTSRVAVPNPWGNISHCFEKKLQIDVGHDKLINTGGMNRLCMRLLEDFGQDEDESPKYGFSTTYSMYRTSQLGDIPDYRSSDNLKKALKSEICKSFLIAQKYQPLEFSKGLSNEYENSEKGSDVTGLKCKTNRTLSFIAMDSLHYHHYAEKLGIDLSKQPNKTAVVILDDKMESHFVMSGEIMETNVRNFIYNYTKGSLNRALSSLATVKSENTHSYPNNKDCSFDEAKFCLKELSNSNFLETISQINKAVIIFYYSKQCSFCNGISYRFMAVAKYFSSINEIQFARVDGDLNLLPWEYTMEIYPTILFIPANQASESRVFPMDMQITLSNLIGFILANLQPSLKLQAMWTLCDKAKLDATVKDCISSLRLQLSHTIDKTLQEWRTSHRKEKSILSLKLQHFHNLQYLFLRYPQNVTIVENLFDRLKLIEMEPPQTLA